MLKYLVAACLFLSLTIASFAVPRIVIQNDDGGMIETYIEKYQTIRYLGGMVEIDGRCISACTLVLAELPRQSICATPQGLFGFHSASDGNGNFSQAGTRLIWHMYPADVVTSIRKHSNWNGDGNKAHPGIIYIKATELVQPCS